MHGLLLKKKEKKKDSFGYLYLPQGHNSCIRKREVKFLPNEKFDFFKTDLFSKNHTNGETIVARIVHSVMFVCIHEVIS